MVKKADKQVVMDQMTTWFRDSSAAIVADYRGYTVAELAELRARLRPANVDLRVSKNTLARRAARDVGVSGMEELLKGPTAIAFCKGDFRDGTRALNDFVRTARKPFPIRGAIVGQHIIGAEAVLGLPAIPRQEQLYAQLLGSIQAPVARLAGVLNATLTGLVYVLQQHANQQQTGTDVAAPDAAVPESATA